MIAGQRAQACDGGKCHPITIMAEPQMAADGSWCVLVMFDSRPGYLSSLQLPFLRLKDPDAAPPAAQPAEPVACKLVPVEPTEAMIDAYWRSVETYEPPKAYDYAHKAKHRWDAMLAAAPHPSQPAEPQRVETKPLSEWATQELQREANRLQQALILRVCGDPTKGVGLGIPAPTGSASEVG
jgi:hypothetical protein